MFLYIGRCQREVTSYSRFCPTHLLPFYRAELFNFVQRIVRSFMLWEDYSLLKMEHLRNQE